MHTYIHTQVHTYMHTLIDAQPQPVINCSLPSRLLSNVVIFRSVQRYSAFNVKAVLQRQSVGCPAVRMKYASRLRRRSRHTPRDESSSEEPHLLATSAMLPQRMRFPVFGGRSVEHGKARLQERSASCEEESETEGRGDDEASKVLREEALFGAASTAVVSSRGAPTTSGPEP